MKQFVVWASASKNARALAGMSGNWAVLSHNASVLAYISVMGHETLGLQKLEKGNPNAHWIPN